MTSIPEYIVQLLDLVFGTHRPEPAVAAPPPPPAKPDPFAEAMKFIMDPSRDGRRNDSAPGETFVTVWGITEDTWNLAVKRGVVTGDIRNMTEAQRDAIYRVDFWNPLSCPALDPGVAVMLFDCAVLSGVGFAARTLQHVVGTPVDGMVGPHTVAAANALQGASLSQRLAQSDLAYLRTLPKWREFGTGWYNRREACLTLSLSLSLP